MADVAPPRHPVTSPADANTYAPYAVLAIIALVVSNLFAVLLIVLGVQAYRTGLPFIQPLLLVPPVIGVVLAFAARRQILNSEGTRSGMTLVNEAWWIAVIGGVGYMTYLVVYQLGVRKDAADNFRNWADHLNNVDLNDPKNPGFFYVFEGTLDPEKHGKIKLGQADVLYRQNKPLQVVVRQSFLVRLANRNRGEMKFDIGGLENWEQDASGQKGNLSVRVTCPEGEYSCNVPLIAKKVEDQWKWQITGGANAPFTSARVTRYGQLINDLQATCQAFVAESFLSISQAQIQNPALLVLFAEPRSSGHAPRGWAEGQIASRMCLVGTAASRHPEPPDYDAAIARHFDPVEKGDPVREAEQRRQFLSAWKNGRIVPSGRVITMNQDQHPILFITRDAVELKMPCEIQTPGGEASMSAARGAVVFRCDDPAFMAKLHDLKKAAPGDTLTDLMPPSGNPGAAWRFVKIESDMKAISAITTGPQGGP